MYRGFGATIFRDVPSYAIYFSSFEFIKSLKPQIYEKGSSRQRWFEMLWTINAGGMAGAISWMFVIPADIVKTK